MSGIKLSDMDLSGYEERELGTRSDIAAEIAEVIATGDACAFDWNSSQVAAAKRLVEQEDGQFFGLVSLSQMGRKNKREQKVRGGKIVEVERYKRELIAVRPI
jgi:hypothetical protein